MKHSILIIWSLLIIFAEQGIAQITSIQYQEFNNGILNENNDLEIHFSDDVMFLSKEDASIQNYTDFARRENTSIITYNGELFRNSVPFDSLKIGEKTNRKDTILGHECSHIKYIYFSNHIDVFYTDIAGIKGSPFQNFIPNETSVVLKVIINGNRELKAVEITENDQKTKLQFPYEISKIISDSELEELKIKSRYEIINVFNEQLINFDPSIPKVQTKDTIDNQTYRFANGSIVLKKIKLPEITKNGAYTFAKLDCRSNGDAYDRTGSVFAIPPSKYKTMLNALNDSIGVVPYFTDNLGRKYQGYRLDQNFIPAIELLRFFTSFGADHFNDKRVINNHPWLSKATYRQDISSLISDDVDEIWIGVFIGNYSKGGHIVNLDLEFFPSFEAENNNNNWVLPLFNTVNIMEMAGQNYPRLFNNDTLTISFQVPEKLEDLQLHFTTTGHGGWGGGDEFNPRLNRIFIDGEKVFEIVPWRTDCGKYRLYNPASGNFSNGLSSSDFSRSNWCPATSTPPYFIPLNELQAGKHKMSIIIDQGEDEGSSFNAWGISGVLTANKSIDN